MALNKTFWSLLAGSCFFVACNDSSQQNRPYTQHRVEKGSNDPEKLSFECKILPKNNLKCESRGFHPHEGDRNVEDFLGRMSVMILNSGGDKVSLRGNPGCASINFGNKSHDLKRSWNVYSTINIEMRPAPSSTVSILPGASQLVIFEFEEGAEVNASVVRLRMEVVLSNEEHVMLSNIIKIKK